MITCKDCISCSDNNWKHKLSCYTWCKVSPLEKKHSYTEVTTGEVFPKMEYDNLYATIQYMFKSNEYFKHCGIVNKESNCNKFKQV